MSRAETEFSKFAILKQERDDAQILYNALFQASDTGIVITDHHHRVVRVNDAFLRDFQWKPEKIIGYDFTKLIPEEDVSRALDEHERLIAGEKLSPNREIRILRGTGEVANILISRTMMEMTGKRRFQVTSCIDISERKRMERALRKSREEALKANHAKSDFLANMSHELRTPLNAIIGFSELMMNQTFGPLGSERYQDYMRDIHSSAHHLLAIINDVLDMSKIEAGKLEIIDKEVDLRGLIETVIRVFHPKLSEADLSLVSEIPDDLPVIKADERMMRQVLMNLLSNSVKFTPSQKKIFLRVFITDDGGLTICVEDQGIGIPEKEIHKVLEPFGQVVDPRHNAGQGTGLGLPLCLAIMKLHQGTLEIESEKGKGTIVTCTLPRDRLV